MRRSILLWLLAIGIATQTAFAASFIVPDDRTFARQAGVIVIASPLASRTERTANDFVETITTLSIERVIKGNVEDTIDLYEPGGTYGDRTITIAGVPRLRDGGRYLLFLIRTDGRWHIRDLALGSFRFATDITGADVVVRDEEELRKPDGSVHAERRRAAEPFVRFLSTLSADGPASDDYDIPAHPLLPDTAPPSLGRVMPMAVALSVSFSATSYTFIDSGTRGARWFVFPTAVSFTSLGTEPGAPGGGVTAINAAMAAWNNDPSSNINYVYAGVDNGTHTSGLHGSDGANTIAFERDLSAYGAAPFQCSANGYSGVLGVGGVTNFSGQQAGPNNESFDVTTEGDVEMNLGIANCTLLFNNGDFNSAVTHEVGHTLGFRHSDQTRADDPNVACSTDPTLECTSTAIMKAFIPNGLNGALQPFDQHAVAAVYPGPPPPPAPTGINARATTSTQVTISWNAATGATSYEIFRRAPGGSFTQISTSNTTSYADNTAAANTAYLYRVRAVNSGGESPDSASDLATTVIFTDDPLVAHSARIKAVHLAELRTAVNAVRSQAGLTAFSFTDSASSGVVVKALHINQLRTALDAALGPLGFATGGYTDTLSTGVVIKAVHFQEIRDRVK